MVEPLPAHAASSATHHGRAGISGRAIALYHRVGFAPEGTKRGSIRVDGEPVDEIVMAMHVTTTETEEHQ
jgi:hypothetical protein